MRTKQVLITVIAVLGMTGCAAVRTREAAPAHGLDGQLDGQAFEVELDVGAGRVERAFLVFVDGTLSSSATSKRGFEPARYSGNPSRFRATGYSASSAIEWSGAAEGGHIEGTLEWTKIDGVTVSASFHGERIEEQDAQAAEEGARSRSL